MLLRYIPTPSATSAVQDAPQWTPEMVLLSDIFHGVTGKPHPARDALPRDTRILDRKLLEQQVRARRRRATQRREG